MWGHGSQGRSKEGRSVSKEICSDRLGNRKNTMYLGVSSTAVIDDLCKCWLE